MSEISIFISHRTADRDIADKVRECLEGFGVPESQIFQSTSAKSGIPDGDNIKETLRQRIRKTDVFILIYTTPDQDWSYCMWELGIATASDTRPTRVVCFSCASEPPKLMVDSKVIKINSSDVERFVRDFHTRDGYLTADAKTAEKDAALIEILGKTSEAAIKSRADKLYRTLHEIMPKGELKVLHRWDYLKLYLPPGAIRHIKELGDSAEKMQQEYEFIRDHAVVADGSQNSALRAFGYQDFESDITLGRLRERWISEIADKKKGEGIQDYKINSDWADDLHADVLRAIFNKKAQRTFNYFESIALDTPTFFRPAVIKAESAFDDSMELDVYLYRLAANEMDLVNNLISNPKP